MSSRTISGWEDFSGNDESGNVGTKVLEKVGKTVEEYKSLFASGCVIEFIESEA